MTKARLEKMVKLITVALTLFLIFLAVLAVSLYIKASTLASKNAALDKKINELSITQAQLEEGISIRKSDAYIEQQAREQLGKIKENETIYIFD